MGLPEARERINLLFDFYSALLTPKQRDIFTMHYVDDCSLAEIAAANDISPQAVADMLKRVTKQLHRYNDLLRLVEKYENQNEILEKIKALSYEIQDTEAAAQIRDLVERLSE